MSIFYRIIIVLLVLAAGYSVFGIIHFKWLYHGIKTPTAAFLVSGNEAADVTVVEFVSYNCGYCKQLHKTLKEAKNIRQDVGFVLRPIALGDENSQRLASIAMAAGLQGKFEEINDAFMEYPEANVPEDFIKETSELYAIDYDRMIKDAASKDVQKILDKNLVAVNRAGINSVPGFVIGTTMYEITDDNVPDLKQILDMINRAER